MNMAVIDIIFWIIILILSIHGAFRGFLDEFFSKIAIIAGIFIGLVFNKFLVPYLPKLGNLIFLTRILVPGVIPISNKRLRIFLSPFTDFTIPESPTL